eukprot:COSAG01_NODE_6751_length_3515_cov_3.095141_2_plen_159_part_00
MRQPGWYGRFSTAGRLLVETTVFANWLALSCTELIRCRLTPMWWQGGEAARLQWPKSFDWADDAVGLEDGRSSGPASAITRSTTTGGVLPLGAPDIWEAVQPAPTPAAHVSSRRRGKKRKSTSAVRAQRSPAPVPVTQPGRAGRPLPPWWLRRSVPAV